MKNLKIILLTFIGLTFYTCDLEEDPIFLDAEATYADLQVARGALDGIYQQLSTYMAMEQRIFVVNGFSGLFVTKKILLKATLGSIGYSNIERTNYIEEEYESENTSKRFNFVLNSTQFTAGLTFLLN